MTGLEQHLTSLMTAQAEQAPDDLGLLSRVQAAGARRTRVRRWTALGAVVATVAGVALGASVLTGGKPAADRFTDPTGFLVDGRGLEYRLPFTPSPLPEEYRLGIPDAIRQDGLLVFTWVGKSGHLVVITVGSAAPASFRPGRETVNGAPAQVGCDRERGVCGVSFLRAPGQFVTINTGRTVQEPLALARNLLEQDLVLRPKIVLGLVPAHGCFLSTPRYTGETNLQSTDRRPSSPCPVIVRVVDSDPSPDVELPAGGAPGVSQTRTRTTVGGYSATLYETTQVLKPGDRRTENFPDGTYITWTVVIHLQDGRYLAVEYVPKRNGWNREELDRFVRAIIIPPKG